MKILDICNLGKYIYLMNKIKKKQYILLTFAVVLLIFFYLCHIVLFMYVLGPHMKHPLLYFTVTT